MIKTILFDLDGTLLPMDQSVFTKAYFKGLAAKLAPHGYTDAKALIDAIWAGTAAMVANDGSVTNECKFWDKFSEILGEDIRKCEPILEDFYKNEFQSVKDACGFDADAAPVIKALRDRGYRLFLATNPIFPAIATESRIKWAGLSTSDFELYTTYENSRHSKPNLDYYKDILAAAGLSPDECLMVGNDVGEDMVAENLGTSVFLITHSLINKSGTDISRYPQGTLRDLLRYLDGQKL